MRDNYLPLLTRLTDALSFRSRPTKAETLRKEVLREYANVLLDDQGLWRMALDYLAAIGPEAQREMSNVVLDVSLDLDKSEEEEDSAEDAQMDEDEGTESGSHTGAKGKGKAEDAAMSNRFKRVEELLRACVDHGMEDEARAICKVRLFEWCSHLFRVS